MIPEIKTVLYVTDLGEHMRPVFRYAVAIARQHHARILMLHILEPMSSQSRFAVETYLSKEQFEQLQADGVSRVRDRMRQRLVDFCVDEMGQPPEQCEMVADVDVVSGRAAETIVHEAMERNADLIVMGTHTDPSFGAHLLGSTARSVTQLTRTPVLVIPVYE